MCRGPDRNGATRTYSEENTLAPNLIPNFAQVLEDELSKPEYGPSVLKHLIQNSSLLGQLDKAGLLENGNTFVEFGSGRGQLTYWLTKAVGDPTTCQFLLVDKASHRHKFDNRLKEVEDLELVRDRNTDGLFILRLTLFLRCD